MGDVLPYGQLLIFTVCNLANGLSISVRVTQAIYPYASNMVMDFKLTNDRSATGYYAGFLCGALMIGRSFGAPFWGWVADKYGRKPVLIVSLLSIIIGSLVFGCARNFVTAVSALFVSGLFCTLAVVCKTCVSEVTPRTLQPKAMSCYALGWYYGQIAGYSVGGLLVHPEKTGFVTGGLLADFPYLLPNLICSILAAIALILVLLFFKETLVRTYNTDSALLAQAQVQSTASSFSFLKSKNFWGVISLYSIQVFCQTGFVETYPLWCWSSIEHGGLNFDPQDIGVTLTASSVVMICLQSIMYNRMVKKLGLLGVIKANSLVLGPVLALLPFIGVFRESGFLLKGALVSGCLIYYILGFNIYTSIFVLTNNSVTQQHRAKVNGFSNGIGYVVKGFTPLLVGSTFAFTSQQGTVYPFDYHFVFTILGCVMFLQAVLASRMPKTLEKAKETDQEVSEFTRTEEIEVELTVDSKV